MIFETPEQTIKNLEAKKQKIKDHIFMKQKEIADIDIRINKLIQSTEKLIQNPK